MADLHKGDYRCCEVGFNAQVSDDVSNERKYDRQSFKFNFPVPLSERIMLSIFTD